MEDLQLLSDFFSSMPFVVTSAQKMQKIEDLFLKAAAIVFNILLGEKRHELCPQCASGVPKLVVQHVCCNPYTPEVVSTLKYPLASYLPNMAPKILQEMAFLVR